MTAGEGLRNGDEDEDGVLSHSMFAEPANYWSAPPPPRDVEHTLLSGRTLRLRLVGHNPLWGHYIWNGARTLSTYIEKDPAVVRCKTVLELGAGAGLPGIVSANEGEAKFVVLTDYPDEDLVENLRHNCNWNRPLDQQDGKSKARSGALEAQGYLWGDKDIERLLEVLPPDERTQRGFDVLLLADLNFNHHCHDALAETICLTLKKTAEAKALVFFTPYRPWLLRNDMAFFDVCATKGLTVRKIREEKVEKVMFEEDRGCETLRRTVFGFQVQWNNVSVGGSFLEDKRPG